VYFPRVLEKTERVLAIDIGASTVRGIVLTRRDEHAEAGGYAQLGFDADSGPAPVAARIAAALDVKAVLHVVLTADESHDPATLTAVEAAVVSQGFDRVSVVSHAESVARSNPSGGTPTELVDSEIASGLLTSHAGLTLKDLAPVVGAGLGVLGLGASDVTETEPLTVWQPGDAGTDTETAAPAEPAPVADDDPFTTSTAAAPAAAAGLIAASTSVFDEDDDVTMVHDHLVSASDDVTVGAAEILDATEPAPNTNPAVVSEPAEPVVDSSPTVISESTVVSESAEPVVDSSPTVISEPVAPMVFDGTDDTDDETILPPDEEPITKPAMPAASVPAAAAAVAPAATASPQPARPEVTGPAPIHEEVQKQGRSLSPILLILGALALIAVAGLLISQCGGGSSEVSQSDTTNPTPQQAEPTAIPAPVEPAAAAEPTAEPAPESTAVPTPEPTAEPAPEPTVAPTAEPTADPLAGLPPLSELPERGAVFRPPILYLEGPVQTQEQADALFERAIAVVGPDNVVNNYVVRPDAPPALDGNVRVEQAVLFATGSAQISEEFIPTLELGVAVMALNPQVNMVVQGHTDSVGSESSNQDLSERRAQAVVEYLVGRGIDRSRLDAVGFGESTPVATNDTAEGRQINRRIEVELLDLLATE